MERAPPFLEHRVATSDVTTLQRSDLNPFLFAGIGTEPNGTTLSVLSVFARHGDDPWQEAARLAALSKADAAGSLAGMIASMPTSPWPLSDAMVIATRLIALLPSRSVVARSDVARSAISGPVAALSQAARFWPPNRSVALAVGVAVAAGLAIISVFK